MNTERLTASLARRELHRSRSLAVILLLSLVALIAIAIGGLAVYAAVNAASTAKFTPGDLSLSSLSSGDATVRNAALIVLGDGIVAEVVGILAIIAAVTPGRRPRKLLDDDRLAIIADDGLIASDLSRVARTDGSVAGADVRTVVARRSATVTVRPVSGVPVERDRLGRLLGDHVAALRLRRALRVRAVVSSSGAVDR